MKNNTLEKIFFILINFCFTSVGAFLFFRLTAILSTKIIFYIHHVNPLTNDFSDKDLDMFLGGLGLYLLYLLLKPVAFLILYKCKKQLPYIHSFFDKFRLDRKFMCKILGIVLFFDIIGIIFCGLTYGEIPFFIFFMLFFGLFFVYFGLIFNYTTFLLFFSPVNEDKIAEDGTIIQSKRASLITNIVIGLDVILIILVFLLTTLIFIA